jgi:serine/threonine-protein kinase
LVEGYPADLEAIVLRTLEKDPEKRYQTADELRVALENLLSRSNRLVTDREISVLVRTTLAASLESKAHALQAATTAIANRKLNAGKNGIENTEPDHGKTGDTARAWNTSPPTTISKKRSLGTVFAVAALVAGGLLVWANGRTYAPSPSASVTNSSTQAATPAQHVTVTLMTEPADAAIRIDDGPATTGPRVLVIKPSEEVHRIEVTREGYETTSRQIVYDRNQEILIGLTPHAPEPAPVNSVSAKPTRAPVAVPKVTATDTSAVTGDVNTGRRKRPKRPLDAQNPFADP